MLGDRRASGPQASPGRRGRRTLTSPTSSPMLSRTTGPLCRATIGSTRGAPRPAAAPAALRTVGRRLASLYCCNRLPVAAAHWAAGRRDERFPHIETTTQEGVWKIDAGYRSASPGSLRVVWTANVRREDRPHLVSGAAEGEWRTEPGYVTRTSFFSTYEAWAPGTAHPTWPNVVADGEEGLWRAASGYELSRAADGTLVATAVRNRALEFVIGAGVALAAQGPSQSREEDGFIARELLRPSAREVRDAGLRGMVEALKP